VAWASGAFYRQWRCDECDRFPSLREARGNCGGDFGPDAPGAEQDAEGRWFVRRGETCGMTHSLHDGAEDDPVYRCPVAMAQAVNRSWLVAAYASTREHGLPLSALGYGAPLSEGGADAVWAMSAAWGWRRLIEDKNHRQKLEAARGRP
jgi:hypothetical protein